MTGPAPARRYLDEPEQTAYQLGWRQMYDHDSFRTLDWIEVAVDDEPYGPARCELRAAMLEGCADALRVLADQQYEGAATLRALVDGLIDEEAPPA